MHVVASVTPERGGVAQAIQPLTAHQRDLGVECAVASLREQGEPRDAVQSQVFLGRRIGPAAFGYSPELRQHVARLAPQMDIIHGHGLWMYPNLLAGRCTRRTGRPLIVSTHGMLEPSARKQNALRKAPLWWSWQRSGVMRAAVLHATSRLEADNLRKIGITKPIAIIPLGIELPPDCYQDFPTPDPQHFTAIFLSRIHPIKGLPVLVEAWARVRPTGWQLVIAGPDEDNHRSDIERAVAAAGLSKVIRFVGPVYGNAKWRLLRQSNLFILPSLSENFGLVVPEALACCVPVITTNATPWSILPKHRCGWCIDLGVESLANALAEATSLSCQQRAEMGRYGRKLVETKFNWRVRAEDTVAVYRWMIGQGDKPACVS